MIEVGSYEAKTHLPSLLERAHRGERIVITRHGARYAVLAPAEPNPELPVCEAVQAMAEFGKGHSLDGITIRQMIDEGRRS